MTTKPVRKDRVRQCPFCNLQSSTLVDYEGMIHLNDALTTIHLKADCGCGGKWIIEEDDNGSRQIYEDEPPTGAVKFPNRDA